MTASNSVPFYFGNKKEYKKVIKDEARARGMDIVMFGHTHRPVIEVEDDITLINPGSISYPRQADGIPTYIMLEIDDNNEFSFELKNV